MRKRLLAWLLVPLSVALCVLSLSTDPTLANDFLDSSIRVNGCSGTVIGRKGTVAIGISAAHCAPKVGAVNAFWNRDGSGGNVTWIAIDRDKDLSLFRCVADKTLGVYPVVEKYTTGGKLEYRGCGYPRGEGPEVTELEYGGRGSITNLPEKRWFLEVKKGKFRPGNSGGGVFLHGKLVGVTTHGSKNNKAVFAAPHDQIVSFLEKSQSTTSVPVFGGVDEIGPEEKVEVDGIKLNSDIDRTNAIIHILKLLQEQREELARINRTPIRVQIIDPKTGKVIQEKAYPFGTPIKLMLPRAK